MQAEIQQERLFNSAAECFTVSIMSGEKKTAKLRYPSDVEWCDRASKIKNVRHNLGRGKTKADPGNGVEVSAQLFDRIAIEAPEGLDDAEKAAFIARLDATEIEECSRIGNEFEIVIRVSKAITVTHVLRVPTARDMLDFSRSSVSSIEDRRTTEFRFRLEPAGTLWNKVMVRTSGYAEGSSVPINHKDAAITELIAQINILQDEDPEL